MKKLFSAIFLLLAPLVALAQAAEPPVEHASTGVVVVFLVLFIGSIAAYGVYLWWRSRSAKSGEE